MLLPAPVLAQSARTIAVLMAYAESDPEGQERLASLREGLKALGWSEGQKARFEVRWLASSGDRARASARELVELRPDVIVVNGSPGLAAIQQLTSSIPVVFVVVTDPVGAGFVRNLSRPAGNITGFSTFEPEIGGKWLEALAEAAPHIRRVGILLDPDQRGFSDLAAAIDRVALPRGLETLALSARSSAEVEHAVIQLSEQGDAGLIVLPTPTTAVHRERLSRSPSNAACPRSIPSPTMPARAA
jgi:putative ABC transport system substrate-binding protein